MEVNHLLKAFLKKADYLKKESLAGDGCCLMRDHTLTLLEYFIYSETSVPIRVKISCKYTPSVPCHANVRHHLLTALWLAVNRISHSRLTLIPKNDQIIPRLIYIIVVSRLIYISRIPVDRSACRGLIDWGKWYIDVVEVLWNKTT